MKRGRRTGPAASKRGAAFRALSLRVQGFTYAEIGRQLGCTGAAARGKVANLLGAIPEMWEAEAAARSTLTRLRRLIARVQRTSRIVDAVLAEDARRSAWREKGRAGRKD